MDIKFLTVEEVIYIHEKLTVDAENSADPISPPGIKDMGMLESAVQRQWAGMGDTFKYDNAISNASSLCYGICSNHPLHNGNKRTALVAMMCHLDKNGLTLNSRATEKGLYEFMLKVASHQLVPKRMKKLIHDKSDLEVDEMIKWVRKKTRRIEKGERSLSYSELEQVLRQHGIFFENQKGNYIDLIKYEEKKKWNFLRRHEVIKVPKKIANIPFFPGRTVGKKLIKSIRQQAKLTHYDGFDSTLFYGYQTPPEEFIQKYKKTLNELAKT